MMKKPHARQKGFTLLELLLSIGILTLMITGLTQVFDSWHQASVNRAAAADMLRMQRGAEDYVLANFAVLIDATKTGNCRTSFQALPVGTLRTEGYLPSSFRDTNRFGQRMQIFCRRVPDATGVYRNSGEAIEVVTLAGDPGSGDARRVGFNALRDAASAGGPKMGVIAQGNLGMTFDGLAKSLTNDWSVTLSEVGSYTSSANTSGGYLASYGRVRLDSAVTNNEILYRTPMSDDTNGDGIPDLNRMETNLDMNGNSIDNVGTIVADFMDVSGGATFNGNSSASGEKAPKALTVEQLLQVDGAGSRVRTRISDNCQRVAIDPTDLTLGYNFVNKSDGMPCSADELIGGDLILRDNNSNTKLTANRIYADNQLTTPSVQVDNTTYLDKETRVVGNMQMARPDGSGYIRAMQAIAPRINSNSMTTYDLQSTASNVTGTTTMNMGGIVVGNAQVNGDANMDRLQMDNAMRVNNNATFSGRVTVTRRAYIDRRTHNAINCTNELKNAPGVKCSNE